VLPYRTCFGPRSVPRLDREGLAFNQQVEELAGSQVLSASHCHAAAESGTPLWTATLSVLD